MMLGRRKRHLLLMVLGAAMLTYSVINLPVESYWLSKHSLKRDVTTSEGSESHKPPASSETQQDFDSAENLMSEWNFLKDLPVGEEDDASRASEEVDASALNLSILAHNSGSPPSAEWEGRLSLAEFPHVSECSKDKSPSGKNSFVYPCKQKHPFNVTNSVWPPLLQPSNGKLLRRISQRRYSDPKVEQLVEEQLQVQMRRLGRIADTCKAYPEQQEKQYLSFVWASKRKPPLVYCPIYKSASTTWMTNFLRLEHLNDDNPMLEDVVPWMREKFKYEPRFGGGHKRVFKDYPKPKSGKAKQRIFESAVRFIVVRHPFDRLVSVYRDKIERLNPLPFRSYFQHLQQAIVARYRAPGGNASLPPRPTFSEFVDYLIESTEHFKTAYDWMKNVVCWIPYWVQCGVCTSDYQVVIKVETMKSDEQLLAYVANMTEIQDKSEWKNRRRGPPPDYFKTLTKHQVEALYLRYKADFELFGYTIDEYLNTARQV